MTDVSRSTAQPGVRDRILGGVFFIALLATAIALGGALAHLFELPNKIALSRDQYFTVQRIYDGWWQFAYVLVVQIVSMLSLLVLSAGHVHILRLVLLALLSLGAAQTVFWIWTQPANVATENWTAIPESWETLRREWEMSHAAGAVFQLITFVALVLAALSSRRPPNAE